MNHIFYEKIVFILLCITWILGGYSISYGIQETVSHHLYTRDIWLYEQELEDYLQAGDFTDLIHFLEAMVAESFDEFQWYKHTETSTQYHDTYIYIRISYVVSWYFWIAQSWYKDFIFNKQWELIKDIYEIDQ